MVISSSKEITAFSFIRVSLAPTKTEYSCPSTSIFMKEIPFKLFSLANESKVSTFKIVLDCSEEETMEVAPILPKTICAGNSFEAYTQREDDKKRQSKTEIGNTHDPNYIKFTTLCQVLPMYNPAQLVIGFEKYFISKKEYQPLYMHRHGIKQWLEYALQLEYIPIRTKLFWKVSPLLHNKTFTRFK